MSDPTLLVHPREVFRVAVIASTAAVVLMHNHPSGEPQPSEADTPAVNRSRQRPTSE